MYSFNSIGYGQTRPAVPKVMSFSESATSQESAELRSWFFIWLGIHTSSSPLYLKTELRYEVDSCKYGQSPRHAKSL